MPDRAARSGTGLSETEVEITPEMISAGAEIVFSSHFFEGGPSAAEGLAQDVFRHMLAACEGESAPIPKLST
jgi:hypothetical protein